MIAVENRMQRLTTVILGILVFTLISCSGKAFTKPRSQIIEEAEESGITMMPVEVERELFFQNDKVQQERLLEILERRSAGSFRDATYRIGASDEVEINVFDVPELNLTTRVGQAGFLSLPLIGAVQATGLTESELQAELKKRLSSFVRDPQVSVAVSHYGSQKVAVLGAVDKPGTYPLKKGTNSVLELLSEAGGVSEKSGNYLNFVPAELSGIGAGNDVEARARLALQSENGVRGGSHHAIEVTLDHILGTSGGIPLEIPVRGGDMIVVPEAGKVMIEGEVEKAGSYELGPRMTLLGALAASGGITYSAKIDEIEIVREAGLEQKTHLVLNLESIAAGEDRDIRLRNGDIIRVPSASGRRLTQDTFDGISKILNFGVGGSVNLAN